MNTKLLYARFTFSKEFPVCLVGLAFWKLCSYMVQSLLNELSACKQVELTNFLFLPTMSAYSVIEYIFMHQFAYGE